MVTTFNYNLIELESVQKVLFNVFVAKVLIVDKEKKFV